MKHACHILLALITCWAIASAADSPRIVCYFPNWGYHRTGDGRYVVDDVDPSLCTHVIYAFAKLDGTSYTIQPNDETVDIDSGFYQKFVELKFKNPKLVTMIAIGGFDDSNDGDKYSRLVRNSNNIRTFVNSVTVFLEEHKFDGLDFDWQYPSTATDKSGFASLLESLQTAFTAYGYYLSVAVPPSPDVIEKGYDIVKMATSVDFVNLMAYDLHGPWNPSIADHHAPLYRRTWELENNTNNIDYSVDYWIGKGMPAEKINMGVPLYGRSWTLATMVSVDPEPPAEADGPGEAGDLTQQPGFLGYNEICYAVKKEGWEMVSDPERLNGPYATSPYAPKTWVGFDDAEMAAVKANYAIDNRLGGSMVWDMSTDDFSNRCGDGNNPLLKSISQTMGVGSLTPRGRFVCYFPNWTGYREGAGRYTVENIDPSLCTDLVYAFATLDGNSFEIKPFDLAVDIDGEGYRKFVQLKTKNPSLKAWIAIGGWEDSHVSDKYSQLVSSQENISKFAQSVISFLRTHGFDGLDIDWEFPMSEGDKQGLADLLYYMRGLFNAFGYNISVAMSVNTTIIDLGYDITALGETVDYVNLMAYDMHGSWESQTDNHAPLYRRPWEVEDYNNNIDYTVKHLLSQGLPSSMLNLGIPLYGQSWTLQSIETNADPTPPARATGPGTAGSLTKQAGYLGYNEICKSVRTNGWLVSHDPEMLNGPYASSPIAPFTWVGYDGPEMAAHKASYVLKKKLGGVMVWDMSTDDFKTACSNQRNPILTAIAETLNGAVPTTVPTELPEQTTITLDYTTATRTSTTKLSTMTRYTTPSTESVTRNAVTVTSALVTPSGASIYQPSLKLLLVLLTVLSSVIINF